MSDQPPPHGTNPEDAPEVTEEVREVIGKARRSFGFSMGILLLGLVAVALALVYRVTREEDSLAERFSLEAINLPAGAEVTSVMPYDEALAVTFTANGEAHVYLIDARTGELLRDVPVVAED